MASGIDGIGGGRGIPPRSEPSGAGEARPADEAERGTGDRIELSPLARDVARLAGTAEALPDVRPERVAALRSAVDSGTYRVDARALARALVDFEDGLGA